MISFRCAVAVVAGLQLLPHQIKGPILHIPGNMFAISHVLSFQITESDGESKKRKEFPEFIQNQLPEAPEAQPKHPKQNRSKSKHTRSTKCVKHRKIRATRHPLPEAQPKQIEALPEAHPKHILVGENAITF